MNIWLILKNVNYMGSVHGAGLILFKARFINKNYDN